MNGGLMKKLICILSVVFALACFPALAEEGYVHSGDACSLGGEYFMVVDEGDTDALVRISGERAYLSVRADELGGILAADGVIYMLQRTGDAWEIVGRRADGGQWQVYSFAPGSAVSGLSVRGGNLFVLIDGYLHIIYPNQAMCLQLVGAHMTEYVLHGDYAYYVSADSAVTHQLASQDGDIAETTVGQLYSVNLSTGQKTPVITEGAADLTCENGVLYFHNFADRYLMETDSGIVICGRLYSLDMTTSALTRATDSYDWDYVPAANGVAILCADGLAHDGSILYAAPPSAQIVRAAETIIIYDPGNIEFVVITDAGTIITAR